MQHSVKNNLLIGFIVSVLLSLFVNFTMLMHTYKMQSLGVPFPGNYSSGDEFLYYSLFWFFAYAFLLFILDSQMYKLGDRLFCNKEYKTILLSAGVTIVCGIAFFFMYPVIHRFVMIDLLEVDQMFRSDSFVIMEDAARKKATPPASPDPHMSMVLSRATDFPKPFLTEHLFILLTVLLSVLLIRLLNGKQQMMLEYEQLKTEKLQTSYNALMGQINPHFFFNSLNGLNSLIRSGEKEQTLTYLDELSNVFRYILQSNKKEMVTLAEELQFVKAYTYLLGVRYEGKLFFSIQAASALLLWHLPILSILPLIENAVKHNVISKQYPLQIDVYTTKESQLVVSNRVQPKVEESTGSGIGLKNLWGRYRMLTGKDIHISNRKDYFKVTLPLLNGNGRV